VLTYVSVKWFAALYFTDSAVSSFSYKKQTATIADKKLEER